MRLPTLLALALALTAARGDAATPLRERHVAKGAKAVPAVVFVSRNPPPAGDRGEVPGLGPHMRANAVGGRLMLRESGGAVRGLLPDGALYDVSDPAVSWDARTIAFAGTSAPDSAWRLYLVSIDGTNLRALTRTDRALDLAWAGAAAAKLGRYDDLDPCWIGPTRLVFASTRWPLIAEYGGAPASNLYAIDLDDPRPRRLTTERNGIEEPAYDPLSGRIVFARWWHNRFRASDRDPSGITTEAALALPADSANLWQLVSFDAARHDTRLAAGDARSRVTTMATQPALCADGAIVATFARHLGLSPTAGGVGIAIFGAVARAARIPRAIAAPRRLAGAALPAGPVDPYRDAAGLASPQACSPAVLPDGRIVFAADPGARGDFEIEIMNRDGTARATLIDFLGTLELDPAPVVVRPWIERRFDLDAAELKAPFPPLEIPRAPAAGEPSFTFHDLDVFAKAPRGAPFPDAPPRTLGARLRFFAALARPETPAGDTAVFVREEEVSARGEVTARGLPVDVPMFEQLVDARGHVLMSAHGPAHVAGFNASASGERRCIGCHAGHSALPVR